MTPGDASVDVSGWAVQYYSATGTVPASGTAILSGSVAPHHTYLVQMAAGTKIATPLPTPDATGTAAMGASSGRVKHRRKDTTAVDRVGHGTAATFEGSPAPTLSTTTSATRNAPCVDTDVNTTDFRATSRRLRTALSTSRAAPSPPRSTSPRRSRRSRARATPRHTTASRSTESSES